eukprot:TRINITY_DN6943_c0_g1_i1.p1 TRINITY_DN6943_c0_g1~~TRINITY_DN6943_c0_g1_i1.p1  ORF type:complete len:748 (+),score=151.95 TRINITY_DN6943_c0_g1_i1:566-2809(+)
MPTKQHSPLNSPSSSSAAALLLRDQRMEAQEGPDRKDRNKKKFRTLSKEKLRKKIANGATPSGTAGTATTSGSSSGIPIAIGAVGGCGTQPLSLSTSPRDEDPVELTGSQRRRKKRLEAAKKRINHRTYTPISTVGNNTTTTSCTAPPPLHTRMCAELEKLVFAPNRRLLEALYKTTNGEALLEVCEALLVLFRTRKQDQQLILWAVQRELSEITPSSAITLFRQVGWATAFSTIECKQRGIQYLRTTFVPLVYKLNRFNYDMEMDPVRLSKGSDLSVNTKRLLEAAEEAITMLFNSVDLFPTSLKHIFLSVQQEVVKKVPAMKTGVISNFFLLRFIAPALVTPKSFGLIEDTPQANAQRSLMLISKIIVNMANNICFGEKEAYMTPLNEFMLQNQPRMQAFLSSLVIVPKGTVDQNVEVEPNTEAIEQAHYTLFLKLALYREDLLKLLEPLNPLSASSSPFNTPVATPINTPINTPPSSLSSQLPLSDESASLLIGDDDDFQPKSSETETEDDEFTASDADSVPANQETLQSPAVADRLIVLLDEFSILNRPSIPQNESELKRAVQDELLAEFASGKPKLQPVVQPTVNPQTQQPSKQLLKLLLQIEIERNRDLEQELKLIKLKLNSETQTKRDLQLQLLRGNQPNGANSLSPKDRERIHYNVIGMHEMMEHFRVRLGEIDDIVGHHPISPPDNSTPPKGRLKELVRGKTASAHSSGYPRLSNPAALEDKTQRRRSLNKGYGGDET